ncbi:MAG: hypothetical protein LBO67_03395 [Spirochaetaceae bacterium]|jgi:hypothetical protein|nr:hypothetical protein [Spirochaetaceae bacterium]
MAIEYIKRAGGVLTPIGDTQRASFTFRKSWNKVTVEGSPETIDAAWMLEKMGITDDRYRFFGKIVFYENLNSGTSVAVCDFLLHKYEIGDSSSSNFIPYNFSGVSNSWKSGGYNWTITLSANSIAASFSAAQVTRARIDIIWGDSNDNTMF